ncbi:hypothetical protein E3N88_17715 [Mikania micrantha]|uniref:Uncharacterized protein n=1 Tax=Mikania micrantha TaxID=192012 RepID=A0A5N6NU05_9ASTR|nr:hypothetical protein E3N88_17715 [Mikania micrantha]
MVVVGVKSVMAATHRYGSGGEDDCVVLFEIEVAMKINAEVRSSDPTGMGVWDRDGLHSRRTGWEKKIPAVAKKQKEKISYS